MLYWISAARRRGTARFREVAQRQWRAIKADRAARESVDCDSRAAASQVVYQLEDAGHIVRLDAGKQIQVRPPHATCCRSSEGVPVLRFAGQRWPALFAELDDLFQKCNRFNDDRTPRLTVGGTDIQPQLDAGPAEWAWLSNDCCEQQVRDLFAGDSIDLPIVEARVGDVLRSLDGCRRSLLRHASSHPAPLGATEVESVFVATRPDDLAASAYRFRSLSRPPGRHKIDESLLGRLKTHRRRTQSFWRHAPDTPWIAIPPGALGQAARWTAARDAAIRFHAASDSGPEDASRGHIVFDGTLPLPRFVRPLLYAAGARRAGVVPSDRTSRRLCRQTVWQNVRRTDAEAIAAFLDRRLTNV